MFCPKCGNSDQTPETYCRSCGTYLPDPSKPYKKERPASEHLKANTVLSAMTIVACFTLAILLWSILGFRPNTHPLIYVTAGLLMGMGGWHIQSLIRTLMLRKQLKKWGKLGNEVSNAKGVESREPKSLKTADLDDIVPPSVTEHTTHHLVERSKRSS